MIGEVPGRIFDDAHPNVTEMAGAPARDPGFARVDRFRHTRPIGRAERNIAHIHEKVPAVASRNMADAPGFAATSPSERASIKLRALVRPSRPGEGNAFDFDAVAVAELQCAGGAGRRID